MCPHLAFADAASSAHVRALDRMMVALAAQNAHASATVRSEYRAYLDHMVLGEFAELKSALYSGGVVPLPANHRDFNIVVRTEGLAPIAEKDLENQTSYIAARASAVGALLDVASQVKSGPLEITSLVRHTEYQDALRSTNTNANTSVPMHTMGLAFDIALINTPLETVLETRDVLRRMQRAGDILFIGERKQLVFHVVPHPSRLGHYADVYARALQGQLPRTGELAAKAVTPASPLARAVVSTEVVAIGPTDEHATEWWAADGARTDLMLAVSAIAAPSRRTVASRSFFGALASRVVALFTGVVHTARHLLP